MSPDLEDLLRGELRGAASGAPHHLGVADTDVLTRGHRVVVRRRILTGVGAAAVVLALAGTIGVLAPRPGDTDTLPAVPTPTTTPTTKPTPTPTTSATATASPTATPIATNTPTPTETPTSSDTPANTATATPSTYPWSDPVVVGGVTYTARVVPAMYGDRAGHKAEVRADGVLVGTRSDANGEPSLLVLSDPTVVFAAHVGPWADVITENDQPVSGEKFETIRAPYPEPHTGKLDAVMITIIKLPRAATVDENDNVQGMVVRLPDGTEQRYCVGFCSPGE
ncbi:hypothetical protein N798_11465 [Knoellia flava TL1]|uniref:Serine/threonine protein kinase n=2 Tax=Knoellia flava TaxID=913969 RepID=A0A8H9FS27_9MICO|nr:hypothetical protein [Knoellia flava]KGN30105.1 hypothetical protein N798_11465 [Knoellia flava TL1]GGB72591.1 hypothetical protein GCM10011314_10080 [Knoellia flava]